MWQLLHNLLRQKWRYRATSTLQLISLIKVAPNQPSKGKQHFTSQLFCQVLLCFSTQELSFCAERLQEQGVVYRQRAEHVKFLNGKLNYLEINTIWEKVNKKMLWKNDQSTTEQYQDDSCGFKRVRINPMVFTQCNNSVKFLERVTLSIYNLITTTRTVPN